MKKHPDKMHHVYPDKLLNENNSWSNLEGKETSIWINSEIKFSLIKKFSSHVLIFFFYLM